MLFYGQIQDLFVFMHFQKFFIFLEIIDYNEVSRLGTLGDFRRSTLIPTGIFWTLSVNFFTLKNF